MSHRATNVVVTGLGVVCAVGKNIPSFSDALHQGLSGIKPGNGTDAPPFMAAITDFSLKDALAYLKEESADLYALVLRIANRASFPTQVALVAALEAWASSKIHRGNVPAERLGLVVAGNNLTNQYRQSLQATYQKNPAYLSPRSALHLLDTDHVGILSHILGIEGEGFTVGGASASGNVGIINGSRLIELGAVDACFVVGALTDLTQMDIQSFLNVGAMAREGSDQDIGESGQPFDMSHRGFIYGQGAGCILLESERSANKRHAEIIAKLRGYGLKLDANCYTDPSVNGEAYAMMAAIQSSGISPRQVSYINAHGTASPLGDKTELAALRQVLGESYPEPYVNSTKGLTGHCLTSAGVIEAIATTIQMNKGFVHPNIKLNNPIDAECRFVGSKAIQTEIKFALSNSFGFGGFNSCIVLESYH